ncbi:MAG TPA: aldo/keto reductase [Candidatus Aquilonibacter sp.]|nr:aldo/keto reductase [Candidatus Aquilonibacter sp.]
MRKGDPSKGGHGVSRRQFLQTSTALAGAALFSPLALADARAASGTTTVRTATDQVTLGSTGIKLSRLGFGTGSADGSAQAAAGKDGFISLIHYAYEHGVTYIDTAEAYQTFDWIGDAIKGLPREKLFIQSKVDGQPNDVLGVIDYHRKTLKTDYIDSLLIHCMTDGMWTDDFKRVMDAFNQAKEKNWIRAKGVSCHTLPALRAAVASDWPEVHLVRVNPQGSHTDTENGGWGGGNDIAPVIQQIKIMATKDRGVIGMKINGNGDFTDPADRDKSIRFAMSHPEIDAVVIGFTEKSQIDEAIERINNALKAA